MSLMVMFLIGGCGLLVMFSGLWVGASLWKELMHPRAKSTEADSGP